MPSKPPEDEPDDCDTCKGAGVITDTSDDTDVAPIVTCPACNGTGKK